MNKKQREYKEALHRQRTLQKQGKDVLDEEEDEFNYNRDKGAYITFIDRRPKIKLRKYIRDCALHLARNGNGNNTFNYKKLIEAYNAGGVKQIEYAIRILEQIGQGNEKQEQDDKVN